jgi:hypothetical protein
VYLNLLRYRPADEGDAGHDEDPEMAGENVVFSRKCEDGAIKKENNKLS